jgi:hypothetical protein
MARAFAEIAFTPGVLAEQARQGSAGSYAKFLDSEAAPADQLGPAEAAFVGARDGFYQATVSETGWPYVQHRGGPRGFLKVIAPARLAFADFRGNRQYVSAGNAARNDRVALIVMDYARRLRLKLLGRLRFEEAGAAHSGLASAVALAGYRARVERIAVIEVEAFDWNCPQHITPRYTREEIPLLQRSVDT